MCRAIEDQYLHTIEHIDREIESSRSSPKMFSTSSRGSSVRPRGWARCGAHIVSYYTRISRPEDLESRKSVPNARHVARI